MMAALGTPKFNGRRRCKRAPGELSLFHSVVAVGLALIAFCLFLFVITGMLR